MKKHLLLSILLFIAVRSFASHIAGGELYYAYSGPGAAANTDRYQVTLRLFRECNPVAAAGTQVAPMPAEVELGIFTNTATGGTLLTSRNVNRSEYNVIQLEAPLPCITNKPTICYQIGYFTFSVDLAKQPYGYTIAFQTCCRSSIISNIDFFSLPDQNGIGEGATYTCDIPGTNVIGNDVNSSAVFAVKDTVLVCQQKKITLDFSATDPDTDNPLYQDSLSYSFCAAYNRGDAESSADIVPSNPPYNSVVYSSGYAGGFPLGEDVVIDPKTGIITGTVGAAGGYVVNVCVTEWRHGQIISVHRKDFLLRVAACDFPDANLNASYINCNSFGLSFQNGSSTAAVTSYYWNFGVPGSTSDTSNSPTPTYTYSDTGTYLVKLVVNKGQQCSDSTTTLASVYPGFKANFGIIGNCLEVPYKFIDSTVSVYGTVNSWLWNFGDGTADDSTQNPTYQYSTAGVRTVSLTVADSKGCIDTVMKQLNVLNKPLILLPFTDTLICSVDTLQLFASTSSSSQFSWSPVYNIINDSSGSPLVYPKTTTTYVVASNDGHGCTNTDSVIVNVANQAFISLGNDTTICGSDSILLNPTTNALYFNWQPSARVNNPTSIDPYAEPQTTTTYSVLASISPKCTATASVTIKVVPYPLANAGPDTSICFGKAVRLNGTENGSSFNWSPTNSLYQANTLTPLAGPQSTTTYVLDVYDTLGCPKPAIDSVTIRVIPPVNAFAGDDTTIVAGQPLQLNATGGATYTWQPVTYLSSSNIPNPIATFTAGSADSVTYTVMVTTAGCSGYANVTVRIFETGPEIFVPSAFTPNGDGKNDVLKPVVVGMKQFNYLKIFNRWGNMLFSSADENAGWDGNYGSRPQPSGTYVYEAQAVDYLGHIISKKGTIVLIR